MGLFDRISTFLQRWQAADKARYLRNAFLAQADPRAPQIERNTWLVERGYWLSKCAAHPPTTKGLTRSVIEAKPPAWS